MEKKIIDPSGAILNPGNPKKCQGNGKHRGFELCCDECEFFLACYPEYTPAFLKNK